MYRSFQNTLTKFISTYGLDHIIISLRYSALPNKDSHLECTPIRDGRLTLLL
nr:MAG TPA: Protein of unknown function (DUF3010) [Caudoviricetes sp.]